MAKRISKALRNDDSRMTKHSHKFEADGDFMGHLEGEERQSKIPAVEVVQRMGLSGDETVVDLGAGTGYFTFPIAKRSHRVVAVDIEPKMISVLNKRISESGAANVQPLEAEMTSVPLPDASADRILAAFVYHEVDSQERLLKECHRLLRPSGKLTVIDFQKRLTGDGPPIWVRKKPKHVLATAGSMFKLVGRHDTKVFYQLELEKQ